MRTTIDGNKNDIRVLCTGPTDSDDAGLVDGVPIDPPDDSPGWLLVDLWVEHDTVQEKGEKGSLTTRKVNPAYFQLWARPKSKQKKQRVSKVAPAETAPKKRGRKPKGAAAPVVTEGQTVLERAQVGAPTEPEN